MLTIVGGTVGIVAGGYYGWQAWSQRMREDPLSRLGPGVHQPAAIAEGDILSIPTNTTAVVVPRPAAPQTPAPRPVAPSQRSSPQRPASNRRP